MYKDDNRVNQAIKLIFDATWSFLIVGQSNSLYETYFCSISSFPPWQPALLQAEHDPRLRSLGSGSRLSRLWVCLWWRRHDDGRWSRGDICDVIVHRVSLWPKAPLISHSYSYHLNVLHILRLGGGPMCTCPPMWRGRSNITHWLSTSFIRER